jgi:predicted PurR-regulated permease PerM
MIRPNRSAGTSTLQTAAILVGVVAVLYLARAILIPLAFAITLTFILAPAVAGLRRLRMGRVPAVLLVMIVTLMVAGGISFVILNQLILVVNDLPSYRENINNKIHAMRQPNDKGALQRAAQSVQEIGKEIATSQEPVVPPTPAARAKAARPNPQSEPAAPLPVRMVKEPDTPLQYMLDMAKPFLAPFAMLGIVLVFTLFLLIEEADLRNRLFRLAGLNRLNLMTQALDDATKRVSRYLLLQFTVNAAFGLLCGTGLYLIGVPYAALWGTVAALLRIVPYVGSVVAGLLPLLLSLAVFDSWKPPVLVFVLFATLELVTANLLEPWLYGSHTGISSLALLLTTVFWTTLWGPAGLILSTPLTVCVVVLGRHVPHLSFLHILLGDQPVLAPDAQIYQRLLAMDEMEARSVADSYLGEHSLVELYDAVMIPALTMAEQDRHKGAIEPEREEFLFLTVREMLLDVSEKAMKPASESVEAEPAAEPASVKSASRVFCLPANDEADEIAAVMLAQLLEHRGCITIAFPSGPSLLEMVALAEPGANDVLCISSVPPFAFSQARSLSRQLRARFPRATIMVGVWGFSGEIERALQRFEPGRPHRLLTSLAEAIKLLAPTPPTTVNETEDQSQLVT